jgi:hypothetical protein
MFRHAPLEAQEVAWASARRLRLLQFGRQVAFEFPCAILEARGSERICGDYEHRPAGCREFECQVLIDYRLGTLPHADAFRLVRQARDLVTGVERRLAGTSIYRTIAAKLPADDAPPERDSTGALAFDPETLLDLGLLKSVVIPTFRGPLAKDNWTDADIAALTVRATDADSWGRLLAPVADDAVRHQQAAASAGVEATRRLREEGFAVLGTVLAPDEATALASVVRRVVEAGWPPVFLFMHPAVWKLPGRLGAALEAMLGKGYEMLRVAWAWHLMPGGTECAGPPRRDRPEATFREDGFPDSITVWIALTDASADRGPVYVVPRSLDPHYVATAHRVDVHDVSNIRALPATEGTAIAWNHRLLHWGGRISPEAKLPCISVCLEFRRAGTLEGEATVDPANAPAFDERLRFVAEQILRCKRLGGVDARMIGLAAQLLARSAESAGDDGGRRGATTTPSAATHG